MAQNPFLPTSAQDPPWILDGGLATTLESRGFDLDDPLWSARVLLEDPAAIRAAHRDFLAAGADIVTTASYQASVEGFQARGLSRHEAAAALRRSVELALEARDGFWSEAANRAGRRSPLVAASVGPYGAFLADGSEYTGRYPVGPDGLREFHRARWRILADTAAELLACETIPSGVEVHVLLGLMEETPSKAAWLSLSCDDATHLRDRTPIAEVARRADTVPNLVAIGANCTDAHAIAPILRELRRHSSKPLIAYPNGGGDYAVDTRSWGSPAATEEWLAGAPAWVEIGARVVGGCCRIDPARITTLRHRLNSGATGTGTGG
ncbi:MAG: homocysteine S-methyltransferase [Gemmatimonadetes bacterium]|nr:homocysteine S-methyltransferase [Gemmatimonadota bacterium]